MMMKKKALVVGASGSIGQNLIQSLSGSEAMFLSRFHTFRDHHIIPYQNIEGNSL